MDTEKFRKLIQITAEAELSLREVQELFDMSREEIPGLEKKMKEELRKPSDQRKMIMRRGRSDSCSEDYLILGYDPDTRLAFLEELRDKVNCSFHICRAIEIERFISGKYIFKEAPLKIVSSV